MDYTNKTPNNLLRKYQWYVIHNPRLSLFGGDEEEVSEEGIKFVENDKIVGEILERLRYAIESGNRTTNLSPYVFKNYYSDHITFNDNRISVWIIFSKHTGALTAKTIHVKQATYTKNGKSFWRTYWQREGSSTNNDGMYIICESKHKTLLSDYLKGKNIESSIKSGGEVITIHSPWFMNKIILTLLQSRTDKKKIDLMKTKTAAIRVYELSQLATEASAKNSYADSVYQTDHAATRMWVGDRDKITIKFHNTNYYLIFDKRLIFNKNYGYITIQDYLREISQLKYYGMKMIIGGYVGAYAMLSGSAEFTLFSFFVKSGISAGVQWAVNDKIDFVDVFADGALAPGWSAFIGGTNDITYNFKEHNWTVKSIFLGTKNIDEAAIEAVIGYAFDMSGELIQINLKNFVKNTKYYNDKLLLPIVFAPVEFSKLKVTEKTKK